MHSIVTWNPISSQIRKQFGAHVDTSIRLVVFARSANTYLVFECYFVSRSKYHSSILSTLYSLNTGKKIMFVTFTGYFRLYVHLIPSPRRLSLEFNIAALPCPTIYDNLLFTESSSSRDIFDL